MLLRFTVQNFLSLRDRQELNFVATPLKEQSDSLIPSRYAKHGVLPVVALYGANASGKSNTLHALRHVRSLVLNSFARSDENSGVPHKPFLLDDNSKDVATEFILDFILNNVRYQFGISFNKQRFTSEWLYAFPNQTQQLLYSRFINQLNNEEDYKFGRNLKGSNQIIRSITRKNTLFISAAAKSGHSILTGIYNYFKDSLLFRLNSRADDDHLIAEQIDENPESVTTINEYLKMADTGISEIKITEENISDEIRSHMNDFFKAISKIGGSNDAAELQAPEKSKSIELGHNSADGKIRYLQFEDESLGTKYLLTLLPSMLSALKHGKVLVLDEITTSLHTLLAKSLVSIFNNKEINNSGAQLIFSTHDTNLLSSGTLRRDEIWFAEKLRDGSTSVYPLTDIQTKNTDNIEKGYLSGRFGAIPFLRNELSGANNG